MGMYLITELIDTYIHWHPLNHLIFLYLLILSPSIMQNDSSSTSVGSRDSAHPESNREQPAESGFSITPQDGVVLQEYLEEFQEADPDERTRIIERAMVKLYHLRPVDTPFDKKVASKVCLGYADMRISLIPDSRKFRNGSITALSAPGVNTSNSPANGPPAMHSII
jgi:hypothetical protein